MQEHREPTRRLVELGLLARDELDQRLVQCGFDVRGLAVDLLGDFPQHRQVLGQVVADHLGVGYVPLNSVIIQPEVVRRLPQTYAGKRQVCALNQMDDVVTVASFCPEDPELHGDLLQRLGTQVSMVFSFPDEIADVIQIHYQSQEALEEQLQAAVSYQALLKREQLTKEGLASLSGEKYVVELSHNLLLMAVALRASDIHIEPGEFKGRVRFRIDGVLQDRLQMESALLVPLSSRLKIMAGCDIAEQRVPQDGRIKITLNNGSVDYRFSVVPTIYGEKIVMRVLGSTERKSIPGLQDLDLSPAIETQIREAIRAPNGVFFITGPTGSGKTTTLYSLLQHINQPGVNIMTIEDPVEYRLDGANQVQVNLATHLDFSIALRAFLRQDPDVILIGEIRDVESARIASQAALTGHLVFATMHTNNALQAVSRLVEIGVEPFLVAPSLIAVMGQRLVRRICTACSESYEADAASIQDNFTGWDGTTPLLLRRGRGCERCHHTGYYGRLGVHEMFVLNKHVRELIARNASIISIEETARMSGFKSLRYDGLKKMLRGLTTLEEIDRVSCSLEN